MKLIDVSGFGNSGKTAATDLFREVKDVHAHHNSFEFDLLRLPDGILDLYSALCDNWSPSRGDFALKRFKRLCKSLEVHYSQVLTPRFTEYSNEYIESLILNKLHIDAWYDPLYNDSNSCKDKIKAILKSVHLFELLKGIYKSIKLNRHVANSTNEVFLSDGKNFIQKTSIYLANVLFSDISSDVNTIITNNAFEPFQPSINFKFFDNVFSVIVDRDPRDIYASVSAFENSHIPEFELETYDNNKKEIRKHLIDFLGLTDINTFIARQRVYREKMRNDNIGKNIICIHYEDMVLDYANTVQQIFDAVGINSSRHVNKRKHFDPAKSVKNVGIWKAIKDKEEIKLIEKELKEYLYTS